MATYALIVELSLDTVRFSLLSWEKFDLCLDTRDELRSKFLRFVHGTVITWPWSFLNTCHSHLMLRGALASDVFSGKFSSRESGDMHYWYELNY